MLQRIFGPLITMWLYVMMTGAHRIVVGSFITGVIVGMVGYHFVAN